MTDVAFDFLQTRKREVPFDRLWKEVVKELNFTESQAMNKIGSFYESMMLDERFTANDNNWDLSSRHKYDDTHIDISTIEVDDSKDEDDLDVENESDDEMVEKDLMEEEEVY